MAKRNHFRKTQARRYRSHSFKNPYFQKKDQSFIIQFLPIVGGLVALILLFGFLFAHPRFSITQVNVQGIEHFSSDLFKQEVNAFLAQRFGLFFQKQNRFLFQEDELTQHLETTFSFDTIEVIQDGTTVTIQFQERASELVWITNDQRYVVDLSGVLIREMTRNEEELLLMDEVPEELVRESNRLKSLPVFVDKNNVQVRVGMVVLKSEEVENIFMFHKHLIAQNIPFSITLIDRLAGKWTGVQTESGYRILFDALGDIETQGKNLEVILKEKIHDPSELDYIDLRFGDHVYYK